MTSKITPATVADYAKKDSRALSKVIDMDLLEELRIRGTEYATLPKVTLIRQLKVLAAQLEEEYKYTI